MKSWKKAIGIILSVAMLFQLTDMGRYQVVFAEEITGDSEVVGATDYAITSFAALQEDTAYQELLIGSEESDIAFPDTLTAYAVSADTASGSALSVDNEVILNISNWVLKEDSTSFDSSKEGSFIYIPVLADNSYVLAEGVSLPEITVNIIEEGTLTLSKIVDGYEITLTADSGVLPEDAVLSASIIESSNEKEKIEAAIEDTIGNNKTIEETISFDITILDQYGNEIQPDTSKGNVAVTFHNVDTDKADAADQEIGVFHVTDDYKTAETVDTLVSDNAVEINAEHFSTYTIVYTTITGTSAVTLNIVDGAYQISSAEDLIAFAHLVNGDWSSSDYSSVTIGTTTYTGIQIDSISSDYTANAKLTADIVLNQSVLAADGSLNGDGSSFTAWTPIGNCGIGSEPYYAGTFDGDGHSISGIYINITEINIETEGLFGYLRAGTVKNLAIKDSYIEGGHGSKYIGSVVGYANRSATISNCYNEGTVNGDNYVGGICGVAIASNITYCSNAGKVTGCYLGGIAGSADGSSSITNCSNVGYIVAANEAYGIANRYNGTIGTVTNCYYISERCTNNMSACGTAKTIAEYNSGEVTWLLDGGVSRKGTWGQSDLTAGVPLLKVFNSTAATVYRVSLLDLDGVTEISGGGYFIDGSFTVPAAGVGYRWIDTSTMTSVKAGVVYGIATSGDVTLQKTESTPISATPGTISKQTVCNATTTSTDPLVDLASEVVISNTVEVGAITGYTTTAEGSTLLSKLGLTLDTSSGKIYGTIISSTETEGYSIPVTLIAENNSIFVVMVTIVAEKITPALTGDASALGTYGQVLSDIAVTDSAAEVEGTWSWKLDENASSVYPDVEGLTSYTRVFTPSNTAIYETLEVEIIPQMSYESASDAALTDTNKGSNGWYTGSASLAAPTGYYISLNQTPTGFGVNETLEINTEGESSVTYYLYNKTTNAMTDSKNITVAIDSVEPVFGDASTITISDGSNINIFNRFKNWLFGLFGADKEYVTVSVVEEGSGVDSISYTLTPDSGTATTGTSTITDGKTNIAVSDGFIGVLTVNCSDNAGNAAASVSYGLVIEKEAPVATATVSPAADATTGYITSQPTITVDASDNTGIQKITYVLTKDGTAQNEVTVYEDTLYGDTIPTLDSSVITASTTATLPVIGTGGSNDVYNSLTAKIKVTEDGIYSLSVTITDYSGNCTTQTIDSLKVDYNQPVLSDMIISSPTTDSDTKENVSVTTNEVGVVYYIVKDGSTVDSTTVSDVITEAEAVSPSADIAGRGKQTVSTVGSTDIVVTDLSPNTDYVIYVAAVDQGGNKSASLLTSTFTTDKMSIPGSVVINGTPEYNQTLTADLSEALTGGSISYTWYRDNTIILNANTSEYTVTKDDVGTIITVEVSTDNYNGVLSAATSMTVEKATPTYTVPVLASVQYSATQKLSSIALTEGWSWNEPDTVAMVNNSGYYATYTPSDTSIYKTVTEIINLPVTKSTPTTTDVAATAIYYGQSLTASTISGTVMDSDGSTVVAGTWSFEDVSLKPASTGTQKVIFTPTDTERYQTLSEDISVAVNQATPKVTVQLDHTSQIIGKSVMLTVAVSNPYDSVISTGFPGTADISVTENLSNTAVNLSGTGGTFTGTYEIPKDTTVGTEITFTVNINGNAYYLGYLDSSTILTVIDKTPVDISGITITDKIYDGNAITLTGALSIQKTGTTENVNIDGLLYTYTSTDGKGYNSSTAPNDAGSYQLVISVPGSDSEYKGNSNPITFTITKKTVTIAALDKSIQIGEEVPSLSNPVKDTDYTVSGLVGSDALITIPKLQFASTPDNKEQGSVAIEISDAIADDNYSISYVNATLTIKQKDTGTSTLGGGSVSTGNTAATPTTIPSVLENEDGTTTTTTLTTTTDSDGTIIKIEVSINKDTDNKVTKQIQTVTVTDKAGNTVTIVTVTDENGKVNTATGAVEAVQTDSEISDGIADIEVTLPETAVVAAVRETGSSIDLEATLPTEEVIKQLVNEKVENVKLTVSLPKTVTGNRDINLSEVLLPQEVLEAAKEAGKTLSVTVEVANGADYTWTFDGTLLGTSARNLKDTNLLISVEPTNNLSQTDDLKILVLQDEGNVIGDTARGVILNVFYSGLLPSTAEVRIYVAGNSKVSGIEAGSKVYLYYYNKQTGKLAELPTTEYTVDENGYVTLDITHCSDYILLPSQAKNSVVALLDQISVNAKATLYVGGNDNIGQITWGCPDTLVSIKKFNEEVDPAVDEVRFTYKSSNSKVVCVGSTGKLTAKKTGTATITITAQLADGTTKTYTQKVIVKKASLVFTETSDSLVVGEKATFTIKSNGYSTADISWTTSKADIIEVRKNKGKTTVTLTAKTTGMDYVIVKAVNADGKTVTAKVKVTVTAKKED